MAAEIDVLKAQIVRQDVSTPWGLKLEGGTAGRPLSIFMISPGSPAARIGLKSGDMVTEIGDQPTEGIPSQQAMALINQYGQSLVLTVERRAHGHVPMNPVVQTEEPEMKSYQTYDMTGAAPRRPRTRQQPPQHQQHPAGFQTMVQPRAPSPPPQPKFYQTYDLNGPRAYQQAPQPVQFTTAQSRPFEEPPRRPRPPPPAPAPVPALAPAPADLTPPLRPPPRSGYPAPASAPEEEGVSQSRTFRVLSSLMANEEPHSGIQGLPPPRSAHMERMKQEWVSKNPSKQRVKVFMAQQYNNPMSLYSAPNVVNTFAQQAEGLMDELDDAHDV